MAEQTMLIRHGETEWSRSGRHTSTTDLPLTESGRDAALRVAKSLEAISTDHLITSPMRRARETAEIATGGTSVRTSDLLVEWNYGEYEGLTTPEIRADRPSWSLWTDGCPGGESPEDAGARADALLGEVTSLEGNVVLFGHGHFLRVVTARYLGLTASDGRRFVLRTATLSILGHERENAVIELWNRPC